MNRRITIACALQVLIMAVVFGSEFFEHNLVWLRGLHLAHVVLALGVAACVAIVAKAGEKRSRYFLLFLTISATIYTSMLGYLFIGEAV